MAAYGFALYWYERRARGYYRSLPIQMLITSFYYMAVFGANSAIFAANYFYDLKGGLLHLIFAKSQIPTAIASFIALVMSVFTYFTATFESSYKWCLVGAGAALPLVDIAAVVITYNAVQFKYKFYHLNFSKCFDKAGLIIDCAKLSNPT